MTFWETEGAQVEQNKMVLLLQKKPTLEEIF
jgi:hypothetical protein